MKKLFDLPVVELVAFQSEDIICTSSISGAGGFWGPEDNLEGLPDGGGVVEFPPDWS